jgi:hypothetical protein
MSESAAVESTASEAPAAEPSVDWKAEARKWESRAKENFSKASENEKAAARLAEIEEANKSESQKLREQLDALTARATAAERDKERLTVLARHQIPEEYQDLVHGSDVDSLDASAQKVKALIEANGAKDRASFVIPDEGGSPNLALNGDGIESALKKALGIA